MQYGFHFNGLRCTGCKTCVLACKDYHDLGVDQAFRQVYEYTAGTWAQDADGLWGNDVDAYYVSVACNHCLNPACTRVCPTGAMHKRDTDGLVAVDARRCVGCGYCELSCPYAAPKVDRTLGRSVKCDGCADRVAQGLAPVCVEACPLRALDFGPLAELQERYGTQADLAPLPDSTATWPSLVVTPPRNAAYGARTADEPSRIGNLREIV